MPIVRTRLPPLSAMYNTHKRAMEKYPGHGDAATKATVHTMLRFRQFAMEMVKKQKDNGEKVSVNDVLERLPDHFMALDASDEYNKSTQIDDLSPQIEKKQ